MPRNHLPGQRSELWTFDVASGERTLVFTSHSLLIEAPNWTPDGRDLVVNGDGRLFRIAADGSEGQLTEIDLAGVHDLNNDHVLSPDGQTVYVSSDDGHLYAVPIEGGSNRRVSNDRGPDFSYYLHGISPDGTVLAYIGLTRRAGTFPTVNIFTIPAAGGPDAQVTDDDFPDDGSEYHPNGEWLYFNSERARTQPGHAQLFRMPVGGSLADAQQLTFDQRVNWFPHVSPDGQHMVYVSFPAGTEGHPENLPVELRMMPPEGGEPRTVVELFGGQGTINVASWSPDSASFAYVEYSEA